jgi:uncharacterized Tic20 family protein
MLRYLACLIGSFAIIAVLPARGQAPGQQAPIQTYPVPEGLSVVGRVGEIVGGVLLLALIGSVIAWQLYKIPQAKDDDKALEGLRIIYGFWLIVAVLLIALLVFYVTLTVMPSRQAADIVAIAGTVTGLITTLTAAFFGIQQAGAGRSQAMTLAQSTRADGAAVGKLDPSYGPHAGGTKVTITGNGFTRASGVNFGATPGTDFRFVNDGIVTVNSPPAQSKDNETKVYVVYPSASPPNSEVGTFYYYTVHPSHGPAAGGQRVTIIGSGLRDVSAVKFGEKDGTNLQPPPLTLDPSGRESRAVTTPAGDKGSDVPVKLVFPVETADKISVVGTYHYDDGVVITPNPLTRASTPQQIRIEGQNLGAVKSVRLSPPQGNPVDATNVSATATVITCEVLISDPVGDWDLHLFDGINATGTVTHFPGALTVR